MKFMKETMPKECLTEYTMPDLLDFEANCEDVEI